MEERRQQFDAYREENVKKAGDEVKKAKKRNQDLMKAHPEHFEQQKVKSTCGGRAMQKSEYGEMQEIHVDEHSKEKNLIL